ncbi:MAG: hypothetical protein IT437_03435 [Phycisphaerales bacterium]|nr:hypothetical protein [Phycisphaerales bacterium]
MSGEISGSAVQRFSGVSAFLMTWLCLSSGVQGQVDLTHVWAATSGSTEADLARGVSVWYDGTVVSALERRGQVAGAPTQPRAELPFVDLNGAEVWRAVFSPLNTGSASSAAAVAAGQADVEATLPTRTVYTTGWYSGLVDALGFTLPSAAARTTLVSKLAQSGTSPGFAAWTTNYASESANEGLCISTSAPCGIVTGGGGAGTMAAGAALLALPPPGPPTCYQVATVDVGGYFSGSTIFVPGDPYFTRTPHNGEDCFVTVHQASTGTLKDVLTFGGTGNDRVRGIAVDPRTHDIVVTGFYSGTDINFNPNGQFSGPIAGGGTGGTNMFVAKYRIIQNTPTTFTIVLYWRYTFGTSADDIGTAVALDSAGDVYVTGYKADITGAGDLWMAKFAGNPPAYEHPQMVWQKDWAGTGDDRGFGVAIDGIDRPIFTGQFGLPRGETDTPTYCLDFDPNSGTDTKCTAGGLDIFVSRFRPDGSYDWTYTLGNNHNDVGTAIANEPASTPRIAHVGYFGASSAPVGYTVDCDPGALSVPLAGLGKGDGFTDCFRPTTPTGVLYQLSLVLDNSPSVDAAPGKDYEKLMNALRAQIPDPLVVPSGGIVAANVIYFGAGNFPNNAVQRMPWTVLNATTAPLYANRLANLPRPASSGNFVDEGVLLARDSLQALGLTSPCASMLVIRNI